MPDSPSGIERRKHPRHTIKLRVHVAQLGEVDGALTQNLSEGGLFIESSFPHNIGSCLPLRLINPNTAEQVSAICEVVRHVKTEDGKLEGLGLKFVHQDAELNAKLRELIKGLAEPPAPPPKPIGVDPSEIEPGVPPSAPGTSDLLSYVPMDSVPKIKEGTATGDLSPLLLHIVRLADGKRTVEEIGQVSGVSLVETLAGLHQLSLRGILEITLDLSPTPSPAGVTMDGQEAQTQAQAGFVDQRVRDYLAEAVRAERAGRLSEAVHLMEQALALKPANAADIHARLARLAMGPLKNVAMARLHAQAIVDRHPDQPEGKQLLDEIEVRERQVLDERQAVRERREKTRTTVKPRSRRGRNILFVLATLGLLAGIGYNVWIFFVPRGPQPKVIAPATLSALIPAKSAQVINNTLYVKVSSKWGDLSKAKKNKSLKDVAAWARQKHKVTQVVASDLRPVLVGKVVGNKVVVYR